MRNKSIIALGLSSMLLVPAYAANNSAENDTGLYAGVGYGLIDASGEDDFEKDNDAFNFYLGSQLNQNVSLEAGYINFGTYGNSNLETEIDGYTLGVNLGLPVNDFISLYVKGGQLWWDAQLTSVVGNGSTNGNEFFYGAGISFALSQGLDLNINYIRFDVNFENDEVGALANINSLDSEIDYAGVSVQYTF